MSDRDTLKAGREPRPDDVVGHVTYADGPLDFRHEPLTRDVADAILASAEAADKQRKAAIPDEATALRWMMDAWIRLKEMGWKQATYAPKDGAELELIEVGSTGIHTGYRDKEGRFWILDDDWWPSTPILYRNKGTPVVALPHDEEKR